MTQSIVTLRDAFEACDEDWLTDAVIQFHARWRVSPPDMGRQRFDAVVRRVSTALHSMELAAATSDPIAPARCFIPCRRYRLRQRRVVVTMDYLWLTERALADLAVSMERTGMRVGAPVSDEARRSWGARLLELGAREWGDLAKAAWPLALQGRIAGAGELSSFDYHCFLASIFWMMAERPASRAPADPRDAVRLGFDEERAPTPPEEGAPGEAADSIERFEQALDRMLRIRVAELNAQACWDALASLGADINDFETIEP